MTIDRMIEDLASLLPAMTTRGTKTVREVCLLRYEGGGWNVKAGGHRSVHIGEWGGDFQGDGDTAEAAIADCAKNIRQR